MHPDHSSTVTAFTGTTRVASGSVADVALAVKSLVDSGDKSTVLVFDDVSSRQVELDLRGTPEDVAARLAEHAAPAPIAGAGETQESQRRSPGRPKLGVVGREVTLLPRHWDWLNSQPGGASVALRKLVEQARRANEGKDRQRAAQESAYRFMMVMAGNEPGFEEASRALYAGNAEGFESNTGTWPPDVREHARALAARAFGDRAAE